MAAAISLVAALDRNFAIGRANQLPWRLPDDLKRFKSVTLGKPVLMGRKTAETLGRALPGRRNLVMSRSARMPFADMQAVASLDEALDIAGSDELMVIGGGEIYVHCLPLATRMLLTHVDTEVSDADALFPRFDMADWDIVGCEKHALDSRHAHAFEFIDYRRR